MLYLIAVPSLYSPTGFNLAPFMPMLITTCVQRNYSQTIQAVIITQQALAGAFKVINMNYLEAVSLLMSEYFRGYAEEWTLESYFIQLC